MEEPSNTPMLRVWRAVPVFDSTIDPKDRFIIPCGIARFFGKEVPVVLVAARPYHEIYRRAATKNLAHRKRQRAPVDGRIRLGAEVPIMLASKIHGPAGRFPNVCHIIVAAGF